MLLTVIAVATLLVAVVGATFAYFSLSVSGNATTTATVTTGKIGSVTYGPGDEGSQTMKLSVTGEQMDTSHQNTKYYAYINEGPGNETPITIAKASLKDADAGSKYTCSAKVTVTLSGNMIDDGALTSENTDWLNLTLSGSMGVSQSIDLSTLVDKPDHKEEYTVSSFELDGPSAEKDVKAVLYLENTTDVQDAIAGKTLTVTIAVAPGDTSCTVSNAD